MPFLQSLFTCNSHDNGKDDNGEIDELKDRISKLEIKYDMMFELLRDIKMSIEVIKIKVDMINKVN